MLNLFQVDKVDFVFIMVILYIVVNKGFILLLILFMDVKLFLVLESVNIVQLVIGSEELVIVNIKLVLLLVNKSKLIQE